MVYKISAVNPEPEQPIEFYYYVCYSDITASADGTCTVNFDDCKVPQDGLSHPNHLKSANINIWDMKLWTHFSTIA